MKWMDLEEIDILEYYTQLWIKKKQITLTVQLLLRKSNDYL